jgi:hypothetical protein
MKIESKRWIAVEALSAAEMMIAVAALIAAILRKWELWPSLGIAFCVCTAALRYLSKRYPARAQKNHPLARVRKGIVGVAIVGTVLLNISAILFPTFTPFDDAFDYVAFGESPGDGWVFAYRSAEYRGYLSSNSVRRVGDLVEFDYRVSPRIDLRRNGIAYFVVHASVNCVTHAAESRDTVYTFTSAGKDVAKFVSDSSFRWTNAQGGINPILKYACARSSN